MGTMDKKGNILRFWRDIEIFTIPSPATVKDQQANTSVRKYTEGDILPWKTGRAVPFDKTREHTIFLAIEDKLLLSKVILQNVASSAQLDESDLENITGKGCLGVFSVNQDGVPLAGTYTPASFVFGVADYRKSESLDGLSKRLRDIQTDFDERRFAFSLPEELPENETGKSTDVEKKEAATPPPYIPFDWDMLREECGLLYGKLGMDIPERIVITIKTEDKPKQTKDVQSQLAFLNSFYVNDLDLLIRQCDQEEPFNKTLSVYLEDGPEENERKDILKDAFAMQTLLDPEHLPSGRWPSPSRHHLMLGQQAAVSGVLARISNAEGLAAVNGPPGTGKTTLLGDIIAEIVVRRAERICSFNKPWSILEGKTSCDGLAVYPIKENVVCGSGIVVSSNNNSAVENITLDLPARSKIAEDEHPGASYFDEVIASIFARSQKKGTPWGLVAGALGNSGNRNKFADGFMDGHSNKKAGVSLRGMKSLLAAIPRDSSTEQPWHEAREKFLSLKKTIDQRKRAFAARYTQIMAPAELPELEKKVRALNDELEQLRLDEKICAETRDAVKQQEPGLLKRLKKGVYAQWEQEMNGARAACNANTRKQKDVIERRSRATKKIEEIQDYLRKSARRQEQEGSCGPVPDEAFFKQPSDTQHLSHVWTDHELDLLRAKCFLAALEVHETTIRACAGKFSANFKAVSAMLKNAQPFSAESKRKLWDILFFAVPVVSTTLASFDRLFSGMGQDSIGWLLIDEAGQATPQSVSGALWRAQRAVVIGDPLQIEPVMTIPHQMVGHIQKKYDLEDTWSPLWHSTQALADRTMDVGAWVGEGEDAVWTGLPLRAHRRCADPMFTISNHIAYDGQMVQANKNPEKLSCVLGESAWINVEASSSDQQVVSDELVALAGCLKQLRMQWPMSGEKEASVYIISPFKKVARACASVVHDLGLKQIQVGTVHTFQGKEAHIVFIVLGSAPGDAGAGSRAWASQKPNILNVALTRAKSLVYIIGNREDWSKCKSFDFLADTLPIFEPVQE